VTDKPNLTPETLHEEELNAAASRWLSDAFGEKELTIHGMTPWHIRQLLLWHRMANGEPQPPDDSGGFCCVMAGMHMGHDEGCPGYKCPQCGGRGWEAELTGVVSPDGYSEEVKAPCSFCGGGGRV
jgi:hypothetical protein